MAFCNKCGAQMPDGAAFCTNCGSTVGGPQPNQQPNPQYQQPNQQYQPPQQPPFQQNYAGPQPPYQQPYGQPGGFSAPIKRREIVTCIILSIVTCGIYGLYWFFCLVNDLNVAAGTPNDQSPGMVLLLSIITCGIYSWIWLYKAGDKVDRIRMSHGEPPSNSAILYLLLAFFGLGIVTYCLIQSEINKVAAA